jgi:hypothetical protein
MLEAAISRAAEDATDDIGDTGAEKESYGRCHARRVVI